ncbi:MAG: hypothetical protein FWC71_07335 [Defluviitaleaceae bacterium]|nr:hypothetical protein [Defluviitaleaceae bacterium]
MHERNKRWLRRFITVLIFMMIFILFAMPVYAGVIPTPPPPPPMPTGRGLDWWVFAMSGGLLVLVIVVFVLFYKPQVKVFTGYMETRALLKDGKYTDLEISDLDTFAGKTTLAIFLRDSLNIQGERIMFEIDVGNIIITPALIEGEHVLRLVNKGNCIVWGTGDVTGDKIVWHDGQQLIFSNEDSPARLEMTYRVPTEEVE